MQLAHAASDPSGPATATGRRRARAATAGRHDEEHHDDRDEERREEHERADGVLRRGHECSEASL